jgi:hypothetical protein
MVNPIIKIHNVETGEVVEREMTNGEFNNWLASKDEASSK